MKHVAEGYALCVPRLGEGELCANRHLIETGLVLDGWFQRNRSGKRFTLSVLMHLQHHQSRVVDPLGRILAEARAESLGLRILVIVDGGAGRVLNQPAGNEVRWPEGELPDRLHIQRVLELGCDGVRHAAQSVEGQPPDVVE